MARFKRRISRECFASAAALLGTLAVGSPGLGQVPCSSDLSASSGHRSALHGHRGAVARLRTLRTARITQQLRMDQTGAAHLFAIFARYDERQVILAVERHNIRCELRAKVDAECADDASIGTTLDRLATNRSRAHALHDERIRAVRKSLSPAQQARLLLLLPRLERDFAEWVHEVMAPHGL